MAVEHPPSWLFAVGVTAFVAAHASYAWAFTREKGWASSTWANAVVLTVVAAGGGTVALGAVRLEGATPERLDEAASLMGGLKGASREQLHEAAWLLVAYAAFTSVMAWRALARWDLLRTHSGRWGAASASLFIASDAVLWYGIFVGEFPAWSFVVLSTYYAAQVCMAFAATSS